MLMLCKFSGVPHGAEVLTAVGAIVISPYRRVDIDGTLEELVDPSGI
jgi:hypothetical protein